MQIGLGEVYALGAGWCWAIAVILFKKSGEHLPPLALNLLKNALMLPLFVLTLWALAGSPWPQLAPGDWPWLMLSGLLGIAAGDTLFFRALNAIGASRTAVTQTLYSPFVIVLSLLYLGERLGAQQLLGAATVVAGIALVSFESGSLAVDARALRRGVAAGVLAVLMMAIGVVLAKPFLETGHFVSVVTVRIFAGFIGMLGIVALRRELRATWQSYRALRQWPVIVAGAFVGTYLSMLIWLAGYKYTQASIAAVLNELSAVFILPLAAIFLRERVRPRQWAGMLLALAGVLLVVTGG